MELDYCKIGLRYSFIYQGTSIRRQRRELFGCGMKLSHVTTSLSTQIKVEAIPLSALPKDTISELDGLPLHYPLFYAERQAGKL